MPTFRTEVQRGEWCGGKGVRTVYHLDKRRNGLRATVLEIEGKPAVVKLVDGDFRTAQGRIIVEQELPQC